MVQSKRQHKKFLFKQNWLCDNVQPHTNNLALQGAQTDVALSACKAEHTALSQCACLLIPL